MTKRKIARSKSRTKKARPTAELLGEQALTLASRAGKLDPEVLPRLRAAIEKLAPDVTPEPEHLDFDERVERMSGEALATLALEGYGDGELGFCALLTLSEELAALGEGIECGSALRLSLFAAERRARIAAELVRRAAVAAGRRIATEGDRVRAAGGAS